VIERATVDVSVALKWALDDEDGLTEALGGASARFPAHML
jgi:hypothetical protein